MSNKNLIVKLNEIKSLVEECLIALSNGHSPESKHSTKHQTKKGITPSGDYILEIVNKIKNCQEAEKIETEILDKNTLLGRVLLPFYICYKYFPEQGLTTGDVEKITDQLRTRVKIPNVSNAVAGPLWKYLAGDSSRVKGKVVVYKLNRKGATFFESLLNAKQ